MGKLTKKKVRIGFLVFGLVIVTVAILVLKSQTNSPSTGSVSYPKVSGLGTSLSSPSLSPKTATTIYASYNYPAVFKKIVSNKTATPVLADYDYKYISDPSWYLNISIYNYPGGNLQSNSDYTLRKLYPARFTEVMDTINGSTVYIFSDNTSPGYNKVAFLVSTNYQATVALNSLGGNQNSLDKALMMVLNSWHWTMN